MHVCKQATGESLSKARATQSNCFWPAEKFSPPGSTICGQHSHACKWSVHDKTHLEMGSTHVDQPQWGFHLMQLVLVFADDRVHAHLSRMCRWVLLLTQGV